jgi:hypothetical protein
LARGGWIQRTILEGKFEGRIGLLEIGGFDHQRFAVNLDGQFDGMRRALLVADVLGMSLFGALEQRQQGGQDRDQSTDIRNAFCNGGMIGCNEGD